MGVFPNPRPQSFSCLSECLGAPKGPSTKEWVKKMWYLYAMEYYSAIKRNDIVPFAGMWMDLEPVIQSEVSQKEKNKQVYLAHICGI